MKDHKAYINILIESLSKKNQVLDSILVATMQQAESLKHGMEDMDGFDEMISKKEILIGALNQLDAGFETIYERVQEELSSGRDRYQKEILILKDLICQVTDKSVKIQTLEQQNRNVLERIFAGRKKAIKDFKLNNQSVTNYYKHMSDSHGGESFFLDQKK